MAYVIRVESERGEVRSPEVSDQEFALNLLLPRLSDHSFACLRFIDPYGQTVFNRMQIATFLEEVGRIRQTEQSPEALRLLDSIDLLAIQVRDGVHLYLKFYGD